MFMKKFLAFFVARCLLLTLAVSTFSSGNGWIVVGVVALFLGVLADALGTKAYLKKQKNRRKGPSVSRWAFCFLNLFHADEVIGSVGKHRVGKFAVPLFDVIILDQSLV